MSGKRIHWNGNSRDPMPGKASAPEDVDAESLKTQRGKRYEQDTNFRKHLSVWVMVIVPVWLVCVMAVVFLCGFGVMSFSASVLIALLATTTANVLGLAYLLLKGLFPECLSRK